jgi:AmmeMemoRadiSam system protein A
MTGEQQRVLLSLARAAILAELGGPALRRPEPLPAWLAQPAAVFVSLHRHGELRGCVGSLEARASLYDAVVREAQAAAFHEPRFPPLEAHELEGLELELSLLSPLEPISAGSEEELIAALRPGLDGLLLTSRLGSAVFIPSMWKQLPDPRAFLFHLERKAGLRGWPRDLQAQRFTAEVFAAAEAEA